MLRRCPRKGSGERFDTKDVRILVLLYSVRPTVVAVAERERRAAVPGARNPRPLVLFVMFLFHEETVLLLSSMRSGLRVLAHEVVEAAAVDTGPIPGVCLLQLAHVGVVNYGALLVDRLGKGQRPLAQQLAVRLWPCKRARRRTVRSAVGCRRPHPLQTCPLLPPKPVGGLPGDGRVHNVADHRLELGHRLRSDALGQHAHGLRVEI
mmetsp:Transcript_8593/g.20103  ORF Transcript_8593/g.20103 Transcript_8593/m.20103 type:complete len:207 (+) Transcript_8593:534-1154(+)